jgi:hypothetical protein
LHPWLWLGKERPNWQRDPKNAKHKEKGAGDSPNRHSRRFLKLSHDHLSQFSLRRKRLLDQRLGDSVPKSGESRQFSPVPSIPPRPVPFFRPLPVRWTSASSVEPSLSVEDSRVGEGRGEGRLILEFRPVSRPDNSVPLQRSVPSQRAEPAHVAIRWQILPPYPTNGPAARAANMSRPVSRPERRRCEYRILLNRRQRS